MFPRLIRWCLCVAAIAYAPGFPPDLDFESFGLKSSDFHATLIKDKLNGAERLYENEIQAPEHLQVRGEELFFTTAKGLSKINENGTLTSVYEMNQSCGKTVCGRPLGFTFGSDGLVYLMDCYNGIITINLQTGESQTIVSARDPIEGKIPMLPNSIVVSKETGKIYWTDSSTEFHLHQLFYLYLGNGKGRLIEYDPETRINRVLIRNLHFANGVMLPEDESFVMVAETFKARILRYYLKGDKAGSMDVLIDNLPGLADNINKFDSDLFALGIPKTNTPWVIFINSMGLLRKILGRVIYLIQTTIGLTSQWFPSLKPLEHFMSSYELLEWTTPKDATAMGALFNSQGHIKEILRGVDGSCELVTSIAEYKGHYYLGSFVNPYLARVKIPS